MPFGFHKITGNTFFLPPMHADCADKSKTNQTLNAGVKVFNP